MAKSYTGIARVVYPVDLGYGAKSVFFSEGGTAQQIDVLGPIDAQDVFLMGRGSSFERGGRTFRMVLSEIEDALNAATADNTYEFRPFSAHSFGLDTGWKLRRVSGPDSFEWLFSDSRFELDPRLLGFPADQSTDVGQTAGEIVPPYSGRGALHIDIDPTAGDEEEGLVRDFRHGADALRFGSGGDPRHGFANEWIGPQTDADAREAQKMRRLVWFDVPGARILEARRDDATQADRAGISTGDPNAQLETWWQNCPLGPALFEPQYNLKFDSLTIEYPSGTAMKGVEMVQWRDPAQIERLREAVTDNEEGDGESYNVDIALDVANTAGVDH